MNRLNNDNLKPFVAGEERTRELAKKGGKKSGEARRKRRAFKDDLEIMLSLPIDKGKVKELNDIKHFKDIGKANIDVQDSLLHSLIVTAMMGGKDGIAAMKLIYEILGEQEQSTPTQQITNIYDTSFLKEKTDEELRLLLERKKGGGNSE